MKGDSRMLNVANRTENSKKNERKREKNTEKAGFIVPGTDLAN
jgi:hypothetical protein